MNDEKKGELKSCDGSVCPQLATIATEPATVAKTSLPVDHLSDLFVEN